MQPAVRIIVLALFAGCAFSGPARAALPKAAASATASVQQATLRSAMADAHRLATTDWPAGKSAYLRIFDTGAFANLPDSERHDALVRASRLAEHNNDAEPMQAWLIRATALPQAGVDDWLRRLGASYTLEDFRDCADALTHVSRQWPSSLERAQSNAIFRIVRMVDNDDRDDATRHRELLSALFDARWTIEGVAPDSLWFDLARLQLAQGNVDRAAQVARRIVNPRQVMMLIVDRRFDRITSAEGFERDLKAVYSTALQRANARSWAKPASLDGRLDAILLRIAGGRPDEALKLAEEVVARVVDGDGATYYSDFGDNYAWVQNNRARALGRLGRWDEALSQLRKAARRPESGGVNVSQSLNLGMMYAMLNRGDDADDAISEIGPMSGYGRTVEASVRLLVALQRDDAAAVQRQLDYLREHRDESPANYQEALVHAGRDEAAIDWLIERLRSERWRADALAEMQDYLDVTLAPVEAERMTRWRRIVALPRVQAALQPVGRIIAVPMAPGE